MVLWHRERDSARIRSFCIGLKTDWDPAITLLSSICTTSHGDTVALPGQSDRAGCCPPAPALRVPLQCSFPGVTGTAVSWRPALDGSQGGMLHTTHWEMLGDRGALEQEI